ncbi:transmembrane protein 234 homolog [Triticum urartu]|uniref:transmembrane protein 234 homolog n=1 Tax=Triticum urartu TaxID=4572 RepID=UPI00204322A4|nr:transmembrane protein 234 homolog [Triticum urartu]
MPQIHRKRASMAAVGGDAASMVAVGLVWGATNALMRRGALVWDRRSRSLPAGTGAVRRWADLLLTWQYSAPFLANLSASAAFFRLLGDSPISVAVPVTNATTFAAALLGEATRAAPAALGTALIVLGVWVCIV